MKQKIYSSPRIKVFYMEQPDVICTSNVELKDVMGFDIGSWD